MSTLKNCRVVVSEEKVALIKSPVAPGISQTLDRGLRVLELVAAADDGVTIAHLVNRLKIGRTIVYRLLRTLEQHALVVRDDRGYYLLSVGVVSLVRNFAPNLQRTAMPILADLAQKAKATATLSIADGNEALLLTSLEPPDSHLHFAYRPGFRHPINTGAAGVAILAGYPPKTGDSAEVVRSRKKQYAVSRGRVFPGTAAVAAPIYSNGTVIASIGIVDLEGDLDESRIASLVIDAAAAVSAKLP